MSTRLIMLLCCLTKTLSAQTMVDKTIPVSSVQKIEMHFDYPELIHITTWEGDGVMIHGTVSINGGDNDDNFEIITSTTNGILNIRNEIKDMKKIPKSITIIDGSNKIIFRSDDAFKKYQQEHGRTIKVKSSGIDMEIQLEIKVPKNIETRVESLYGMVEVKDFAGPLTVEATYGGVDAALNEPTTGELSAETNYGEIYTNFVAKFGGKNMQRDFYTYVSAKPGVGPSYAFISKYGNVYIRKSR